MIREATYEDIPELIRMGHIFVDDLAYPMAFSIDETSLEETLAGMIKNEDAAIFVSGQGGIGGILAPFYFNKSQYAAQELFWWVMPKARNSRTGIYLLNQFESWAKEKGAVLCIMNYMENGKSNRLGDFFKKRGYKLSDHAYARAL